MHYLIILCFGILSISAGVFGNSEPEPKRGEYPYLGFIYYMDETIRDATGARFFQSALLIKPNWLVSSAIADGPGMYPEKTLLARLGAVNIDANYTYNQDEDEQEQEVIQIVRPYNYSRTQWWITDISLMKTLLPFTNTSVVSPVSIDFKHEFNEKNCIALIFLRKETSSEERVLMQTYVDLLPPSIANCGAYFHEHTMTCAADNEDKKTALDQNFCQGNSGGPLICENEIMAIQSYINNDCKPPHLYQLLSAWEDLIACSTQETCSKDICLNTCDIIAKDTPDSATEENITSTPMKIADADNNPITSTSSKTVITEVDDEVKITSLTGEKSTAPTDNYVDDKPALTNNNEDDKTSLIDNNDDNRTAVTDINVDDKPPLKDNNIDDKTALTGNVDDKPPLTDNNVDDKPASISDEEEAPHPHHTHPTRPTRVSQPDATEKTSLETKQNVNQVADTNKDILINNSNNIMSLTTRAGMVARRRLNTATKSYSPGHEPNSKVFYMSFLILAML